MFPEVRFWPGVWITEKNKMRGKEKRSWSPKYSLQAIIGQFSSHLSYSFVIYHQKAIWLREKKKS